jgi:hypothetical protein
MVGRCGTWEDCFVFIGDLGATLRLAGPSLTQYRAKHSNIRKVIFR